MLEKLKHSSFLHVWEFSLANIFQCSIDKFLSRVQIAKDHIPEADFIKLFTDVIYDFL